MKKSKKMKPIAIAASLAFSATAAMAATTPFDLIRPTWPLSWDSTAISKFDTTVTKKHGVLNIPATPESFKAGALMPDTLDQAYYAAINTKISPIRVNQAGYLKSDKERQFYYIGLQAGNFEVVDADGKSLSTKITGTLTETETETTSDWTIIAGTDNATATPERYKVQFTGPTGKIFVGKIPQSVPTEKRLRIKVGDDISSTFIISDDVYTMVKDASLKFFGIQRSGNSESWFHGPSHVKDGAGKVVNGIEEGNITTKEGDLQGGWYDMGDHLKDSQTQAFAFMALAVMSATNPTKDVDHYAYNQAEFVNTDKVPDVLREAKHGADFFLRAFRVANGIVDDMPVSVGNYGSDHSWWGRPEAQDYLNVEHRGGPAERDVRLGELGSNVSGEIAAGLAILSKDYAKYDKDFADSCLMVAEKMYDFAKSLAQGGSFKNNKRAAGWSSPLSEHIGGNDQFQDDLTLASVALLYATTKEEYANDMIRAEDLCEKHQINDAVQVGYFAGGWPTCEEGFLVKAENSGWSATHTYALYALYKLILADKDKATKTYGLTEDERLDAIEDCLGDMIANLGYMNGIGSGSIILPFGDFGISSNTVVTYDPIWYTMSGHSWLFNVYQIGNIFDVLAYADVAADIEKQGITLPNIASDLKASEMRQLGINQLNYLLGVNPWDISFVYGVGDKNDAHPHHRAANPEGKNMPGLNYKYVVPTGALIGWGAPGSKNSMAPGASTSYGDYHFADVTLNGAALLTSALTFVSNGGSNYYEKKCDNCKTGEISPFSGEIYAAAYHYTFADMDYFNINLFNETLEDADSVVAYIYFEATQEEMDGCGAMFTLDICQAYDIAGFNKSCENHRELIDAVREQSPKKVEDTYNEEKKTYTWEKAINLGTAPYGRRMRLDIGVSAGTLLGGKCEILMQPSKVNVAGGWSFTAHTATKDAPAYEGAPDWDKDDGDYQRAPEDPYIVLRSKGKLLWGYGPGKTTNDRIGFVKKPSIAKARMQVNNNKLYVLTTAQGTKTVKIFDMLGNQLSVKTFDGTRAEVNLANLPHRGALIARVVQNGKVLATQSIKVK